jgi:hypothetical protein
LSPTLLINWLNLLQVYWRHRDGNSAQVVKQLEVNGSKLFAPEERLRGRPCQWKCMQAKSLAFCSLWV